MTDSQYISVREAAQILGINEKKVMDLIDEGKLQAYKIAKQFLRLKKNEISDLRNTGKVTAEVIVHPYSAAERLRDFLYYNDFYLACTGIVTILVILIFQK